MFKNLFKKLVEQLERKIPGYLAYCEDCGYLKRITYLKDAHRFMCKECIVRYTKLYIKINKIEINKEKRWAGSPEA